MTHATPPPLPSTAPPVAPRPARRPVGIYVWAGLIGLAACIEGAVVLFTAADFNTVYERPTDRPLVYFQFAGTVCAMMAMLVTIFWWKIPRRVVLASLFLAAAIHVLALRPSRASIADAIHRRGDWGALNVASQQFSFGLECAIALLCVLTAAQEFLPTLRNARRRRESAN